MLRLDEEKSALLRKLIRDRLPSRVIAAQVGCGTGTVSRMKKEMGLDTQRVVQRVTHIPAPKLVDQPEADPPSESQDRLQQARTRLAVYDPLLRKSIQEPDDGE